MSAWKGVFVKTCLCSIAESQRTKPHVHLPSACRLFSLYLAFTARFHSKGRAYALREWWKAFFVPDSVLIFSTKLLGKVGHVGIHWKKVKWWVCINMHVRDSRGEKLQVRFVSIITGHELSLLVKLQRDGDCPVNCAVSSGSDHQMFWGFEREDNPLLSSFLPFLLFLFLTQLWWRVETEIVHVYLNLLLYSWAVYSLGRFG